MKMKTLFLALSLVVAGQAVSAAEYGKNAVTLSLDGRILQTQGTPTSIDVMAFGTPPTVAPISVPATCRTFDIVAYMKLAENTNTIEGVPYGQKLIAAWYEASTIAGRTPDSIFYCMADTADHPASHGVRFNRAYQYQKADGSVDKGQIVSFVENNLVIGVEFWGSQNQAKVESKYLSLSFGSQRQ